MITKAQKNAIDTAEVAVKNDPANFEHYIEAGIAYFHADQFDEALAAVQQAIALKADSAAAYNWLGRVYYHLGPAQQAITAYEQAIALDPQYIEPYYGLGILYSAQLGDYDAALKAFQRGLDHNPAEAFLLASLGSTYARAGRFAEALNALQQAINLEPDNSFAYGWLSIIYLHQKRYDEMIAACQREIEIADAHSPRRMLGYVYDWQGRYEEAIAELEQSVRLEPSDYEARAALAKSYRRLHRHQEADEQEAIAREMAGQDNEYGQSCLEAVSGNLEEALALLAIGLAKGQLQPGWARIDPEFAFIYDDPRFKALIGDGNEGAYKPMKYEPQTWHYGLVAQYWAEFNVDGPEIAYYQKFIEGEGQPALDVACGTGRLLLPYLRAGLDVDGCDISPDMLALCREKAAREGFSPGLYAQAMHELDLPRRYQTIYVCGSFGIGGTRQQNGQALRRFYEHLVPGGVLLLDEQMPYSGAGSWHWKDWLAENRQQLDPNFWTEGQFKRASDGSDYRLRSRLADLDPLEQILTLQMRAELWRDEQLVKAEERTLTTNIYFKNELLLMLKQAGFAEVTVCGDFTEETATPEHTNLVFIARKQS